MRLRGASALLAATAVLTLGSVASARTPSTHACPTFTGPYDNLIHSKDFRVANVSCSVGKRVVEKCDQSGAPCRIAGDTWRCHAHQVPGEDRCTSGRKVAEIYWED